MTQDQKILRYYSALKEITKYMEPEVLRKKSGDMYGLDDNEAIEMAYDNVLQCARNAIRGHRPPGPRKPKPLPFFADNADLKQGKLEPKEGS